MEKVITGNETIDDKLNRITRKAIARSLGACEVEGCSEPLKSVIKAHFWDLINEMTKFLHEDFPDTFGPYVRAK